MADRAEGGFAEGRSLSAKSALSDRATALPPHRWTAQSQRLHSMAIAPGGARGRGGGARLLGPSRQLDGHRVAEAHGSMHWAHDGRAARMYAHACTATHPPIVCPPSLVPRQDMQERHFEAHRRRDAKNSKIARAHAIAPRKTRARPCAVSRAIAPPTVQKEKTSAFVAEASLTEVSRSAPEESGRQLGVAPRRPSPRSMPGARRAYPIGPIRAWPKRA